MTNTTLGKKLVLALETQPWADIERWLDRDHPDLLTRINRLSCVDDEYRLDCVHEILPSDNLAKMGIPEGHATIWRAMPAGCDIRPGDWIALSKGYANKHAHHIDGVGFDVKSMAGVSQSDVYWAGTDENEFFYLPAAWRKECETKHEYLTSLTSEQLRMLCDGEESNLTHHQVAINAVKDHVIENFDEEACGGYHGPDHWARVCQHGHAVARSLGVDPLVAHVFAWVHDSQREDDGFDYEHGGRSSTFVKENRESLFAFLDDEQVAILEHACAQHSFGETQGDELTLSCWDADRLDLWRVGNMPDAQYLCTAYAKDEYVIKEACKFSEAEMLSDEHRVREMY